MKTVVLMVVKIIFCSVEMFYDFKRTLIENIIILVYEFFNSV